MEVFKIYEGTAIYFLTFTIVQWLPVFVSEEPCLIITDSLNYCHHHKGLRINAFVIMPTHLHLIVFDAEFRSRTFATNDDGHAQIHRPMSCQLR
ncbi:MAG: hypothetical protein ACE5EY_05730 [Anaerolineae bacterium]